MIVTNWRRVVALSLSFWMQVAGLVVLIYPELRFAITGVDTGRRRHEQHGHQVRA